MNRINLLLLALGVLATSCGPSVSSTSSTSSEGEAGSSTDGEQSSSSEGSSASGGGGETGAALCSFSQQEVDPDDHKPECDDLPEDECLNTPTCQAVHGQLVDSCAADSVECSSERVYLGCSGLILCKEDVGFFCAPDFSAIHVAERRCNPPRGTILCSPDVDDPTRERLVDSVYSNCI